MINQLLTLVTVVCLGMNLYSLYQDVVNKNYKHLPFSLGFSALMLYFLVR